jgi:formylmethanofuran dehydrogenase subunit C
MNRGTILIDGSAGIEVGMRMKRGIIAVRGPVRDFAGLQMKGGTIFLMGGAEIRTGAWMQRGTIVALTPIRLLPTFGYAATYQPTFLRLYCQHLNALGFSTPDALRSSAYKRYMGDASVPGKGEILICQPG